MLDKDKLSTPHVVFLLIKLLYKLEVHNWKHQGISIKSLNDYAEKHSGYKRPAQP
jgi:hypothetical protein